MKRRIFIRSIIALGLVLLVPLHGAEAKYLKAGSPDAFVLLPAPPAPDSPEQSADLIAARALYDSRSPEQLALAKAEIQLTIFNFSSAIGPWFQPGKFPKTEALFKLVSKDAKEATNPAKDFWKRARPFSVDSHFVPIEPDKSYSYPSGHSTRGTVFALLLAELFPEKREAILEIGRGAGWHRIVGGVHYPSDIFAGRVLGQAIARELLRNETFRHDLEEARVEIAAGKGQ